MTYMLRMKTFKEELKDKAEDMRFNHITRDSRRECTNKYYKKLFVLKNKKEALLFDRLPLSEYQKQCLVYNRIDKIHNVYISDKWTDFEGNKNKFPLYI